MRSFLIWSQKHPFLVVIVLALVSALAATQVNKLTVDASAKSMMVQGDPAMDYYKETTDLFGSDSMLVVFLRDKALFSPDRLADIEDMVYAMEDIPGVIKVESLYSVTNFKSVGGMLESNPLLDWVPETQDEADQVLEDALANPSLRDNLVSENGQATAINLYLDPDNTDPTFNLDTTAAVEKIVEPYKKNFEALFQLGAPYNFKVINDIVFEDQLTLVPMAAAALLLMLVLAMRTPSGAILPMMTSGLSVLWTVGFMGYFGIPLTVLTFIVPSLIIVIGATEDIHILCEYMEGLHESGGIKDKAIAYMAGKVGTAVMLTALTTFLGFLSISINKIMLLKQFGMVASFGLFANPIITCLLAPVYLHYFGPKHKEQAAREPGAVDRAISRAADGILHLITTRKRTVLTVLLGASFVVGLFGLTLKVDNDVKNYFKKDSSIIQRVDHMEDYLAGSSTFFIRISGGDSGVFKKTDKLKQVAALQEWMQTLPGVDKTTSITDYIKNINKGMNFGEDSEYRIPDDDAVIPQYLLFLRSDEVDSYATADYDQVNILVRHSINSSFELKKTLDKIRQAMKEKLDPHMLAGITGENILVNEAADSIAIGQVQGIAILLVVIFILMTIMFVNVKAGLLSLIPNLFPVFLNFGIMAIFNVPLNTGTCMVAAVAIGIAVDDTIHFMSRYNKEMRDLQDRDKAVEACIRSEITPVISSSVALSMGFGILAFAQFVPVIHFGILSAMVMVFALMGDLFVTPILLSSTQLITIWDMVALKLHRDVLTRSRLFQGLRSWQMKRVVLLGRFLETARGEAAVKQGDHGKSMYLLLEGAAKVYARDDETGKEITFATLKPGDVFGEIALVEPGPRSAHVMAEEDMKYIEIDWDGLKRIQRIYPRIASRLFLNLSRIMGERLVATDKMVMGN